MTRKRLAAITTLLALAVCAYLSARLLASKGLSWAANVTQVASFIFTVAAALVPFVGTLLLWLRGAPPTSKLTLQEASDGLAKTLARQWAEEDIVRRTYDPYPLPVRWHSVNAVGEGQGSQEFKDIHSAFAQAQRLVILGPAGAGKSVLAVKLVRDLLEAREPGGRIPVLLPAATWTNDAALTDWIIEQLVKSQPSLDVRVRTSEGTVPLAQALADGGVIPVIDGLDELPVERRAAVITEINAYGSEYPLVLTSRPEEYGTATAARPVSRAVVVELQTLRVNEVKTYLTDATSAPRNRWQGVFSLIDSEPDGVLATVLTNPLMIWLTRTVYEAADTNPGELLDNSRFPDSVSVESHLIAGFVPAAYSGRPRRSARHEFRCKPEHATRWLGFIADGLSRRAEQDIAWWRLSSAEPLLLALSMAFRAAAYALIYWQIIVWALGRRGYWHNGVYAGRGHFEDLLLDGPLGQAVRPPLHQVLNGVFTGASSQIDSALRTVSQFGQVRIACLAAAVGLVFGWLELDTPLPRKLVLTRSTLWAILSPVTWFPVLILVMWYSQDRHVSPAGFLHTLPGRAALIWLGLATVSRITRSLKKPVEVTATLDPVLMIRADRNSYLTRIATLASYCGATWLWSGGVFAFADGAASLASIGIVLLFGSTSGGAWPRYLDARLRLGVRGRMPWRMMSFLSDAHRRGVLRQSGATYQFRHIRLQERLADGYSPWPAPLAPVVTWAARKIPLLKALFLAKLTAYSTQGGAEQAISVEATAFTACGSLVKVPFRRSLGLPFSVLIAVATVLTVFTAAEGSAWAVLVAVGDLAILLRMAFLFDKRTAFSKLPSGRWSIRISADAIDLTRDPHEIRLAARDITLIGIRPIMGSWSCHVLAAKLSPAAEHREFALNGWLPLYWTPDFSAKIPGSIVSALSSFAGKQLDPQLGTWLRRQELVEYEESGNSDEIGDPASGADFRITSWGIAAASLLVALFATLGWDILLGICCAAFVLLAGILLLILSNRASTNKARKMLPGGPWSIRVLADSIDLTHNGDTLHIGSDEVDRITFRSIAGSSERVAVQVRLRPGSPARGHATDGWLPLYWATDLSQRVPRDLIAALAGFAGERLVGQLKRRAEGIRSAKAPVYRLPRDQK